MKRLLCVLLSLSAFVNAQNVPSNEEIVAARIRKTQTKLVELTADLEKVRSEVKRVDEELVGRFDSDSRLLLKVTPELPAGLEINESRYILDGRPLAIIADQKDQDVIFDDFISQGDHQLDVEIKGSLSGRIFEASGKASFTAEQSNTTSVVAVFRPGTKP
ncbi:hypothetical protein EHM76_03455, partial [bacterium]